MGELFQNNHHFAKEDANFAKKWFEFDLTYFIMRGLHAVKIIQIVALTDGTAKPDVLQETAIAV